MKLKIYTVLIISLLIVSCGSKKHTVRTETTKEVVKKEVVVVPVKKKSTVKITKKKTYSDSKLAYIDMYSEIAMEEMRKYKIPASITLSQGILESRSGQSGLTLKSNNHFGIKCHKGWNGGRTYHDDDEKGECFRVYKNPETSFKDHSLFLAERSRYSNLFKLKITDYKGWAKGLRKAGYATDKAYPKKLIAIIEKYQLYKYDDKVLGKRRKRNEKVAKPAEFLTVVKGDTLFSIAKKYGLTVNQLKSINGLDGDGISIGQKIFIKK